MGRSSTWFIVVSIALARCATPRRPAPVSAVSSARPAAMEEGSTAVVAATASNAPTRGPRPLTHAEVEALVSQGLGYVLARLEVSPVLVGGRFVGFRLDRALDVDAWLGAGVDVRVGDVIVRINGERVERPEQALWIFERLRIASSIDVNLVRNGQPIRVHAPILDRGVAAAR